MVYRAAVALLLLFTALIGGAALVGKTQSNPLDALFTNPDGSACQMPCLFGVRPGQMTLGEALQVLQQHPLTRGMRQQVLDNGVALESEGLVLLVYSDDGIRISSLALESYWLNIPLPQPDPRLETVFERALLGNLVTYLGTPSGLVFNERSSHVIVWSLYPELRIAFIHAMGHDLDRRLAFMDINGPLQDLFVYSTDTHTEYPSLEITHWLGFTSVEHYQRDINAR